MPDTTPRLAIPSPLGSEAPDTDQAYQNIANAVDALAAIYGQGTFANLPVSSPGTPGKEGRFYVVTSGAEINRIYYDYGTGWIHLNPDQTPADGSITVAKLAATLTGIGAKIPANEITNAHLGDSIVGFAELAAALKPSQGAAGAAEALRAIGSGAGNVVAGNDARLTDQRTPTDNTVSTAKIQASAVTAPKISVPRVKVIQGAVYSVPDNVYTLLPFDTSDTESYDNDSMHNPSSSSSRLTIVTAGIYRIVAQIAFANPSENGLFGVQIVKNGSTAVAQQEGSGRFQNCAFEDDTAVGWYYDMYVYQSHGPSPGALNTADPTFFSASFITN